MGAYGWAHQQERAKWKPVVAAGQARCAEPVCLYPSRTIPAAWAHTKLWNLSHDVTGTRWIGPSHRRCNLAENARRNNPKRAAKRRRWIL